MASLFNITDGHVTACQDTTEHVANMVRYLTFVNIHDTLISGSIQNYGLATGVKQASYSNNYQ
jgi:hypothetical protein